VNIAAPILADAGRMCPADYVYPPAVFDRAAAFEAGTLYVAGGLYGNLEALAEIERLAAAELTPTRMVFNGDFHWFDAEPRWFEDIEAGVARHLRLRGNVETEIARSDDVGAGCGCAYPPSVDEGIVRRSNEILGELRAATPLTLRASLADLPMYLVANVGGLRIGIVHGDAASLAGWRFAHDSLDDPKARNWLSDVRRSSRIDVFASTHTCLAALRDFDLPAGRLTIANNGAASMPNFSGTAFGLVTRIATSPSPHPPLCGMVRDGVHIDALPVAYDRDAFLARFLARWPEGTPAHISYFERIEHGPDYAIGRACG
jgi:hypothetical protein